MLVEQKEEARKGKDADKASQDVKAKDDKAGNKDSKAKDDSKEAAKDSKGEDDKAAEDKDTDVEMKDAPDEKVIRALVWLGMPYHCIDVSCSTGPLIKSLPCRLKSSFTCQDLLQLALNLPSSSPVLSLRAILCMLCACCCCGTLTQLARWQAEELPPIDPKDAPPDMTLQVSTSPAKQPCPCQ